MFLVGDPHQGRRRFSLAAGGHEHNLLRGKVPGLIQGNQYPVWNVQVSHVAGHVYVVHHAPAHDAHFPFMLVRGVYHLLDAGNKGGEGRHHDPPFCLADDPVEGLVHDPLGRCEAGQLGVGGVGAEQQDSTGAVFGQSGQVNRVAVDRGVVDLEVPGVNHRPNRSFDDHSHGIGDAVADPEPRDLKVVPEPVRDVGLDGFRDCSPGGGSLPELD